MIEGTSVVKPRWYARNWFILVLLVLCVISFDILFPLGITGIYLLWRYSRWSTSLKWLASLAVPLPLYFLIATVVVPGSGGSVSTIGSVCLGGPAEVVAGPRDSIYVLDRHRVLRFASGGDVLWQRPAAGDGGLAADAQGNVYINDPSFLSYKNRGWIEKLSPQGHLLARWPANEAAPSLVDSHGVLYAIDSFDSPNMIVRRLQTTSGKLLGHWRARMGRNLVQGPTGTLYIQGMTDVEANSLLQVSAATGRTIRRWRLCRGCSSLDALASDTHGTLFAGLTNSSDTPFEIARLTPKKATLTFSPVNASQEQVGWLGFDSQDHIYVIRDSYDRPSPTDTGLDELSASGSVIATFNPCQSSS